MQQAANGQSSNSELGGYSDDIPVMMDDLYPDLNQSLNNHHIVNVHSHQVYYKNKLVNLTMIKIKYFWLCMMNKTIV